MRQLASPTAAFLPEKTRQGKFSATPAEAAPHLQQQEEGVHSPSLFHPQSYLPGGTFVSRKCSHQLARKETKELDQKKNLAISGHPALKYNLTRKGKKNKAWKRSAFFPTTVTHCILILYPILLINNITQHLQLIFIEYLPDCRKWGPTYCWMTLMFQASHCMLFTNNKLLHPFYNLLRLSWWLPFYSQSNRGSENEAVCPRPWPVGVGRWNLSHIFLAHAKELPQIHPQSMRT